ncbi:Ras-related protein RIC1 [Histomonas meleagridis]|uniref:Ras-related protein RIC1 n=1 Tax=Histomonas meleagridis TaxID=135588 RepID=UPI00355A3F07|nr:Ras-related protein RIC1 [Histomonas meleagridis]KAH0807158.1 Ras-related protein RIC1 [Histomonas meleagridis]
MKGLVDTESLGLEEEFKTMFNVDGKEVCLVIGYACDHDDMIAYTGYPLSKNVSSGIIIIYSIENRASFDNIEERCREIQKSMPDVPIIIVGNKTDLKESRCVSTEEGQNLAQRFGIDFIEISIKSFENVEEAFAILTRNLINIELSKNQNTKKEKKKAETCTFA